MEDKFKELFDDFQPEVDPQVWNKISSRLPASSGTSSPGNGSGLTKNIFASSAVKLAIIAGAVITAAVIYVSRPESSETVTVKPEIKTEQTPVTEAPATEPQTQQQVITPANSVSESAVIHSANPADKSTQ